MLTLRTVAELRAWRHSVEGSVGLVPTMGAFHAGHLSLIDAARRDNDHVVVWLFVNPAQFNEQADLAAYPRDEADDARLAEEHGADVLLAPGVDEVYPPGFATTVTVAGLGDTLEGAHRPGHFAGVATVVTKMLNIVGADRAYFGAKDAQQVALVRRLVADLNIPTEIVTLPIVREPDGLALSSRNVHLSPAEREQATALSRALRQAAAGDRESAQDSVLTTLRDAGIEPEYVAVVDPETFAPATNGRALIAVAARVGTTRLIDNVELP
ncbi:MAG: pantoate--beta-alanine ligase [Solirubrobacteraceae bacterium]|jgi:pantoate--beta-alanine ligase|nr:pantoate--beta-alanine ligase [Solirubrobacteraceae bacterium]